MGQNAECSEAREAQIEDGRTRGAVRQSLGSDRKGDRGGGQRIGTEQECPRGRVCAGCAGRAVELAWKTSVNRFLSLLLFLLAGSGAASDWLAGRAGKDVYMSVVYAVFAIV